MGGALNECLRLTSAKMSPPSTLLIHRTLLLGSASHALENEISCPNRGPCVCGDHFFRLPVYCLRSDRNRCHSRFCKRFPRRPGSSRYSPPDGRRSWFNQPSGDRKRRLLQLPQRSSRTLQHGCRKERLSDRPSDRDHRQCSRQTG